MITSHQRRANDRRRRQADDRASARFVRADRAASVSAWVERHMGVELAPWQRTVLDDPQPLRAMVYRSPIRGMRDVLVGDAIAVMPTLGPRVEADTAYEISAEAQR